MILLKKLAIITIIAIAALSCRKEDVNTNPAENLMGYYSGNIDQVDTVSVNGNPIQMKYASWLRFYIQKSENAPFAIKYFTNTNFIINGYIHTGSKESEGLIENIKLTEGNLFFINETPVELWGRQVLLKGNGSYDEASNSLILNLSANDYGKIRQLSLRLPKQKRLD